MASSTEGEKSFDQIQYFSQQNHSVTLATRGTEGPRSEEGRAMLLATSRVMGKDWLHLQ